MQMNTGDQENRSIETILVTSLMDYFYLLLRVRMRARNVNAMINHQKRQRGTKEIPGRTRSFDPTTFAHDAFLGLFHHLVVLKATIMPMVFILKCSTVIVVVAVVVL